MSSNNIQGTSWYGDVLVDLSAACRRDGLVQSAEMLDDLAVVLEQEQSRLIAERNDLRSNTQLVLKVISN